MGDDKRCFLFKRVPDKLRAQLLLDAEALYSTTDQITADKIVHTMLKFIPAASSIIDATACVGGSTLALATVYSSVTAVEMDDIKFTYLEHNIDVLGLSSKVKTVHADCIHVLKNTECDAVFLDPPWGGPEYKTKKSIDLCLSDKPLHAICRDIQTKCKYIVLKAPVNFNEAGFSVATNDIMELIAKNVNLRKMILLIYKIK